MGRKGETCVYAEGDFMIWTRAQIDAIFALWFLSFQCFQRGLAECTPGAQLSAKKKPNFVLKTSSHVNARVRETLHTHIRGDSWSIIFFSCDIVRLSSSNPVNRGPEKSFRDPQKSAILLPSLSQLCYSITLLGSAL